MPATELTADQFNIEAVFIQEEEMGKETGGNFRAIGMEVAVGAAAGDYESTYSWPTPRSLMAAEVDVPDDWVGDEVTLLVAPNTIVGTLTSESAAAATVHDVEQSVLDNIVLGYMVTIGTEALGECIAIGETTITTQNGLVASAASGSQVKITVCMGDKIPMTAPVAKVIGESKIGGSYLAANKVVKVIYHRATTGTAFTFKLTMEMLY
jgi:hypothetical protein